MLAPDRAPFRLANHDMLTAQPECGIRLPLIGVVQGSFAGMGLNLPHDRSPVMRWDGHGLDAAITLDKPKHNDLACRTPQPSTFALSGSAKGGFIAFDGAFEWLSELFDLSATGTQQAVKAFTGSTAGFITKSLSIAGHPQDKQVQQAMLDLGGQSY